MRRLFASALECNSEEVGRVWPPRLVSQHEERGASDVDMFTLVINELS